MKLCTYFSVKELVHPDIVEVLGETRAGNLMSIYLLKTLDKIRAKYGMITVNDYAWGGKRINSGLRKASFYTNWLGMQTESYSTHQYGNTVDMVFSNEVEAKEVFDYINANQSEFPFIVRMENAHETETWLHIECGKYREETIEVFNP